MLRNFIQYINTSIITLVCLFAVGAAFQPSIVFAADAKDDVCAGVGLTGADCSAGSPTSNKVPDMIKTVISLLSYIIGIAAVIMVIIGGFKYVFSNGDSGSISNAKNTIIYALVGLAVAMLAQLIVRFVINKI